MIVPSWLNEWGSFFEEDNPTRPIDDIVHFARDVKRAKFVALFNDLEDGQVLEDMDFVLWLHPDFVKNHICVIDSQFTVTISR